MEPGPEEGQCDEEAAGEPSQDSHSSSDSAESGSVGAGLRWLSGLPCARRASSAWHKPPEREGTGLDTEPSASPAPRRRLARLAAASGASAVLLALAGASAAAWRGASSRRSSSSSAVLAVAKEEGTLQVKAEDTWLGLPGGFPSGEALAKARAEAVVGEELRFPEVLRGPLTLKMQQTKLPTPWIGGYFYTRGYGSIPGPTIRVRPGEVLDITLENDLGPGPGMEACDFDQADLGFFMNPATICGLNYTNLHTHGLHTSPVGNGDNIFNTVAPGKKMRLKFRVPENHMGGTHWYHPHHHHSTAAQAGGGAHGALLVDDAPGSVPKVVEDMEEKLLFISFVNIPKSMRLESWGLGTLAKGLVAKQQLWKHSKYKDWEWGPITGAFAEHGQSLGMDFGLNPVVVVNGQWRPKMTIEENRWYRFRFVFASIEQRVELFSTNGSPEDAFCYLHLLAKDGIYLHEAPRPVDKIYLVSGSRADVAVMCRCGPRAKRPCHNHLNFTAKWQPMGMGSVGMTFEETTGEALRIETRGRDKPSSSSSPTPLQTFSVRRPCYLSDLRNVDVAERNKHELNLPQLYPMQIKFDGKGHLWGHGSPKPIAKLRLGEVQEWSLTGIRFHPFHLHVNPFQIVEIQNDPWYRSGDWHDTILPVSSSFAAVRINIDHFPGKMVAHCHLLEHEDNGMMGFFDVVGYDGETWRDVWQSDSQCYRGRFPGPPLPPQPPQWR